MKKLTITLAIATFAFMLTGASAFACGGANGAQASANGKASCNMAKMAGKSTSSTMMSMDMMQKDCPLANGTFSVAVYEVDGLTCGGCELNLTRAFEASDGVVMVPTVSYTDGAAKVIYDPTLTNPESLAKVISDAGYKGVVVPAVAVSNSTDQSAGSPSSMAAMKKNCSMGSMANANGTTSSMKKNCSMGSVANANGTTSSMKKNCSMGSMANADGTSSSMKKDCSMGSMANADGTTSSMKKNCSMGSMANADGTSSSMKKCCSMGSMANASGSMDMSHCLTNSSQLTSSEMAAFCQKFCMSGTKATKTSVKPSKDAKDI